MLEMVTTAIIYKVHFHHAYIMFYFKMFLILATCILFCNVHDIFCFIQVPNVKIDATKLNPEELGKLYTDVKMWKNKQDHINAKLETMKR